MKFKYSKIILTAILIAYITGCSTAVKPKHFSSELNKYAYLKKDMDVMIEKNMSTYNIRGISISMTEKNKIIYTKGFGYIDKDHDIKVTPQTLFRTASVSKAFTSIAMMKLEEKRKINIDSPIKKYLPLFRFKYYPKETKRSVSIRTIMTHHSGIPNISSAYELSDNELNYNQILNKLKGEYLTAPTGIIYNYSNLGIALLGGVIENKTHKPYSQYMQKNILAPLGMHASKFTTKYSQDKFPYQHVALPTMGLVSNVVDLSRFIIMLNNEGKIENKKFLKKSTIDKILKIQNGNTKLDVGRKIGLGVDIDTQKLGKEYTIYSRIGSLERNRACIMFMPKLKIGVVILANTTTDYHNIKQIAYEAIIKLWEVKTGNKFVAHKANALAIKAYNISGKYNVENFGAISILKDSDNTYTMKQLATNEPLKIKRNTDNSYSLVLNMVMNIFASNPFKNKKFYFTKIDGKSVIVLEDEYGNRDVVGQKIKKKNIPDNWKKALGEYVDESGKVGLTLKYNKHYLERAWKENNAEIFSEFIKPINENEAIVDNLVTKSRITLQIKKDKDGREFIQHLGMKFFKEVVPK